MTDSCRPLVERRTRAALLALLSMSLFACAAAPLAAMPVPASPAAPVSTDPTVAAAPPPPAAPPQMIAADFVIDSSTVVKASVADIHSMLLVPQNLTHVLPYTRSAEPVAGPGANERHVRLVQGTSLVNVEYTLKIDDEGAIVRFHLVKEHPHGIDDCQGFFELTAEAPDRTRVRFVDAVDLGKGVARFLFKEQIRKSAATTPVLVQKHMESGQPENAPPPNGIE